MSETKLIHGDCLEKLKELPDCSVDSVVTDPPYGLSFMGKRWDYDVPSVDVWTECLRVLKPGGHLLAFAGTRTQHRMAVRIEDAGFEIRDMIAWVYGSGFPKSLDVSKAIDKAAGAEREVVGKMENPASSIYSQSENEMSRDVPITAPATEAAQQWQGWGTALKPALEPITVARKPLGEKTVATNVLEHGTGAINVDGCRVGTADALSFGSRELGDGIKYGKCKPTTEAFQHPAGRWPANFIHDGNEEVLAGFPTTTSGKMKQRIEGGTFNVYAKQYPRDVETIGDTGSAARFFYCAKASKKDRDEGCEGLCVKDVHRYGAGIGEGIDPNAPAKNRNHHPTVKPTDLMRYLCRLVTPPGGIVLDPFMGSGSTGKAAELEGFNFIGIEREESYMEIAEARINSAKTLV
jgi:site-specific DNA-methyltransferase (adenine-specific)